ncbi:tricarballylate utilization 4Fe-4S protein TcuB [Oceanicola sp. D3]|uniref:tricarballylate utilization 4Fe-4S protein TcuB n=1 Tax=Oceanicola sp. D3 TaxID=2587163 RepID=UPI001122F5BF|nr:tricarballylate utilization 4Fe-4S protein TcuB [Oceanicola sp. D3]QDC10286.1 tricarballylate utilization 4Fe-4S protein TcuB [Oceanicola sp. D3]
MSVDLTAPLTEAQGEAARQIEICNACRYCEGYCSVFPAMFKERAFDGGDITQLANLCHNCRGCYYACQYTEPHEFALNLPAALAEARSESWERHAWPGAFARLFQRQGTALAAALVVGIAALFWAFSAIGGTGEGFYAYLSHAAMVAIFAPAFLLPLLSIAISLRGYWREVGGRRIALADWAEAGRMIGQMRNLDGGQGQGCNFEKGDRFSNTRRHAHQAVLWGFLLCFASTASGTLMHYLLGLQAPYALFSLPKLLGIPGGLLLVVGTGGLAWLKTKADPALGDHRVWGGEMGFILLLGVTGLTGLILYAATGTPLVPGLLALHLGAVLAFFLTLPYSKMAHGFYRTAALLRDAQIKRLGAEGP